MSSLRKNSEAEQVSDVVCTVGQRMRTGQLANVTKDAATETRIGVYDCAMTNQNLDHDA